MTEQLSAVVPAQAGAAAPAPRVLGLDLSLASSGIAYPDGTTHRIRTRTPDGDRRLITIRDTVRAAIEEHRPHLAVLEDLPTHAHSAGITGMVHGVVRAIVAEAGVPRALIAPATLKSYACDHGRATKRQMTAAAYLAAGAVFEGDLNRHGEGGDQCDAWWLRAAGHDWLGAPLFDLPAKQRDRLAKAKWPPREAVSVR